MLTNKKNLKKAKPFVAKLSSISDSIRDMVIKNYLSYCYYQYSAKYLQWRAKKLQVMNVQQTKDGEEAKKKENLKIQNLMKTKKAILFD